MNIQLVISFDIGGTFVKWGIIDVNTFKIIEKGKFPTRANERSAKEMLHEVATVANDLYAKYPKIIRCGISSAGAFDKKTSVELLDLHTIPGYKNLNVKKIFNQYCKLPVYINNDAKCALLAEAKNGSLVGIQNGVLIAIGTGIGSSILIDGKIYNGSCGCAGEIGMININNTFFEINYSIKHFIHESQKYYNHQVFAEQILEDKNPPVAVKKIISDWYNGIARSLTYIIAILNPEKIVFTGAVCHNKCFSLKTLQNTLNEIAVKPLISFKKAKLSIAKLKGDAQLLGAAFLGKE